MKARPARKRKVKRVSSKAPKRAKYSKKKKSPKRSVKSIVKKNKKVVKNMFAVLVFGFSTIFIGGFFAYKYLNQNFVSASNDNKSVDIELDKMPTLAYIVVEDLEEVPVQVKNVKYFIFEKELQKVEIYPIPLDLEIDAPGEFGAEEFSKLFALGGLNSDDPIRSGIEMTKWSLVKLFGFKVDGYVLISEENEAVLDNLWEKGSLVDLVKLSTSSSLNGGFKTDLGTKEFYSLIKFTRGLPEDRILVSDNAEEIFESPDIFDSYIKELTLDSDLAKDSKNISILNGSGKPGLAGFISRVTRNLGGRVVATDNAKNTYEVSSIISNDPSDYSTQFMSRILGIENIISAKEARNYGENVIDRSDITVIVGLDKVANLY